MHYLPLYDVRFGKSNTRLGSPLCVVYTGIKPVENVTRYAFSCFQATPNNMLTPPGIEPGQYTGHEPAALPTELRCLKNNTYLRPRKKILFGRIFKIR